MAISYGAITVDTDESGSVGSFSFAHDNGGDDLLILTVSTSNTSSSSITLSNVQYDGVAMIQKATFNFAATNSPEATVFTLANPASGSNIVSGTFSANPFSFVIQAVPAAGADTADPIGDISSTKYNPAAAISESLTTDTDDSDGLLLGVWRDGTNAPPVSAGASMTTLDESQSGTNTFNDNVVWLGKRNTTTAGAYSVAATANSSERAIGIGFELHEGAAPAGGRIMSSLAGSGGLAYKGGIAGPGGGLAG